MTKLKFEWDGECQIAWHNGYRIRAEKDDHAENPLENWDGNWPCLVRYDGSITEYDKIAGPSIRDPLSFFSDEQLVHDQIAIAKALNTSIPQLAIDWMDALDDDAPPPRYIHDADALSDAFYREMHNNVEDGELCDVLAALFDLAGIPALSYYSRGYCQGDCAELLIVATPAACKEFGTASTRAGGPGPYAHVDAYWEKNLAGTGDLYGAWVWDDVYGYIVEFAVYDEDGEIEDWEEVEHGSCWGFYGDDFDESGLAEAALDAVPDEPAPAAPQPDTTETVGSSDKILECV